MSLIKCDNCNKLISDRGSFCFFCGNKLSVKKNEVKKSSKCKKNDNNIKKSSGQSKIYSENQSNLYNGNKSYEYAIEYLNENKFKKMERAIKKYNMLAYKKLLFDYYPSFRDGNFSGRLIEKNELKHYEEYLLVLPTDKVFQKVHGNIELYYKVFFDLKIVLLEKFEPNDILTEGHQKELTTYKGVMVSKTHKDTDMFKINLLNMIEKNKF